jgi:hypothetical protein
VWLSTDLPETLDRKAADDGAVPGGEETPSPEAPPAVDRESDAPQPQALLWSELDTFQEELLSELDAQHDFERLIVGASAVGVTGLAVGYVTWALYGGSLVATMISTMPAWASFDPLPILDSFAASSEGRREEDDISFESLVAGS